MNFFRNIIVCHVPNSDSDTPLLALGTFKLKEYHLAVVRIIEHPWLGDILLFKLDATCTNYERWKRLERRKYHHVVVNRRFGDIICSNRCAIWTNYERWKRSGGSIISSLWIVGSVT